MRQRHTQCQPSQEGNGDDGVSSAPTDDVPVAVRTAGGSDQLTDRLRWAILPLQAGLRWNRWLRPGGRPSELLGKFRSVQRQLSPAADKPSHMLLPALCHELTYAMQQIAVLFDRLVGERE